jgi:DNA-binding GntR family transcriptional regulator
VRSEQRGRQQGRQHFWNWEWAPAVRAVQPAGCNAQRLSTSATIPMAGNSRERRPPGRPVYQRLKWLLINYQFPPSDRLQAVELADRLGVSATPVREALIRLYAEGMLVSIPNRGFFSKPLNLEEMSELYEMAFVLMRHAIEKNVAAFTLSDISRPAAPAADASGGIAGLSGDALGSYAGFVEHLFERIVSLSGNAAMLAVTRNFIDRTHYVRLLDLETPGHLAEVASGVDNLIERLQQGDVAGAIDILGGQLKRKLAVLPELVKEGINRHYRASLYAVDESRGG